VIATKNHSPRTTCVISKTFVTKDISVIALMAHARHWRLKRNARKRKRISLKKGWNVRRIRDGITIVNVMTGGRMTTVELNQV
jgi:hypothetical protein